jgi:short subunit dehydrogenase-like uncharacterized protein
MQNNQFLIYGANGYTGQIISKLAAELDLNPVLAGRNKPAIQLLSSELHLPYRIIDLDDEMTLQKNLADVALVLHAAGPFQLTARPMMEACIATGTHYLDITGEIPVFEMAKTYGAAARAAGVMLMPGVGFDVVPTDCMAVLLHHSLPGAIKLQLAFATQGGSLSHGTAATMVMGLGEGGAIRQNGEITQKPLGHKGKWVDFSLQPGMQHKQFVMCIPWGDISTAYFSTGIPEIETYTAVAPSLYRALKLQGMFNWLLRSSIARNYILKRINQKPAGPAEEKRANSSAFIWGEVENAEGRRARATMRVMDGYTLTAYSSLLIVKKVLSGNFKTGFQTPAATYGEGLVMELPGTKRSQVVFSAGS